MKKSILFLASIFTIALSSCVFGELDDSARYHIPPNTSKYVPIVMKRSDLDGSIKFSDVKPMDNAGKIYVKDQYIFIVDKYKGVHVYNNQNPTSPVEISFLQIPGATDIAIRDQIYYVNQVTDLVAIDIHIPTNQATVTKRLPNMFPQMYSPDGYWFQVEDDEIIVDWKLRD